LWKLFDGLKEDIALNKLVLVCAQTAVQEGRAKKYPILEQIL